MGAVLAVVEGAFDRALNSWGQRGQDDLAALAADLEHPVGVLLAQVLDHRPAGFEDPQTEQSEHGDEGEVVDVAAGAPACNIASNCRCDRPEIVDGLYRQVSCILSIDT